MALSSYYSNWGSIYQFDMPELSTELLDFHNSFSPLDICLDPDEFFYSDNYTPLHLLAPQLLSPSEFEPYWYPKRPNYLYEDQYYFDLNPGLFDGFVPKMPLPEFSSEPTFPVPEFESPPPAKKPLSAQSIAARQRRRKITEKTQELGKLIPGGQKMNTAEMFEAASKYIKYLQGQIAIFQIMEPVQVNFNYSLCFPNLFLILCLICS